MAVGAVGAAPARAGTLAYGFVDNTVFSGLQNPTAVRFAPAPDTRVFVAQKDGLVYAYPSVSSRAPVLVADLRTQVDDYWDRGLLSLAVDPNFPAQPYLYLLYTYDAPINGTAPVWNDRCPSPPGPLTDGCVVSGRLSRIQINPTTNTMVGSETPLINDWCQQYPSHSIGDLAFGPNGELLASGGTGAAFTFADYGQGGGSHGDPLTPRNPCGDPPVPVGGTPVAPTAEGGSLRAQSFRRTDGPATLDGSLIRIDPRTGAALPDNPARTNADINRRRIVAYGLRQPFRFTTRPGTGEVWVGDVGENTWEEIDRMSSLTGSIPNFGWPCYEGAGAFEAFQAIGLNQCKSLYSSGSAVGPYYTYNHDAAVVAADGCTTGQGSSITGLAFANGGPYPDAYRGALFFADHTRNCIWAMLAGSGGLPDPSRIVTVASPAGNPVDLQRGPDGAMYYADLDDGEVHRLGYMTPQATASAAPTSGDAPLTVTFTGDASSDPDPNASLSYHWDFGDRASATTADAVHTYARPGTFVAVLTVSDQNGATASRQMTITAGATPPTAAIAAPTSSLTWAVGDQIDFAGSATDAVDGSLPPSDFSWSLVMHHCRLNTSSCHVHHIQDFNGVSSGSFAAPDHAYPSYLELDLTVTNSSGLHDTRSVMLYPRSVNINVASDPPGATIGFNDEALTAPFQRTVIVGSANSLAAPPSYDTPQATDIFQSWSDGAAADHNLIAPATDATLTALYARPPPGVVVPPAAALSGQLSSPPLLGQSAVPAPIPALGGCSLSPDRLIAAALPGRSRHTYPSSHGPTLRCTLSTSAHVHVAIVSAGRLPRSAHVHNSLSSLQFGLAGRAGPNTFDLRHQLAEHHFQPGRYRLTVVAEAGPGRTSRPAYADFVVVGASRRSP